LGVFGDTHFVRGNVLLGDKFVMEIRDGIAWGLTCTLLLGAVCIIYALHIREQHDPWTRDGQIQADIMLISSPCSGRIQSIQIKSDMKISKGAFMFSVEETGTSGTIRKDNVASTVSVYAPADAYVMPCTLQQGSVIEAGQPLFSLVVANSFWVTGFFRETLIRHIHEGDSVKIVLMAYPDVILDGEVESIGWGIARKDGELNRMLLPEVTPDFDWIRLAQRIPVHIRLKDVPQNIELRVGLTASIQIVGKNAE
jgi:multidrug resistance efflux pump